MEDTLSSEERMAILGQLAARKPVDEKKEAIPGNAKSDDFGSLLERSLKKQAMLKQEDAKISDETRKEVIEKIKPKMDIIKGWRF